MQQKELLLWLGGFFVRSGLTKVLFEELIQFISTLMDDKAGPLRSFYMFEQALGKIAPLEKMDLYVFCEECKTPVLKDLCANTCIECGINQNKNSLVQNQHTFVGCSVEVALRNILELSSIERAILEHKEKMMEETTVMRDAMDSKRYKEITDGHDFNSPRSLNSTLPVITLMVNIDGVAISKSSKRSIYPLMLVINELPPHLRQENIIIPFLFMNSDTVDFNDKLLGPWVQEMNRLNSVGFCWTSSLTGEKSWTRVIVYCFCLDAMMKPKLLGLLHPSAYISCPSCFVVGEYAQKGKGGSVVFLSEDPGISRKRTCTDLQLGDGQVSIPMIMSLDGIGDIFKMTAIDSMHNCYLGVCKYVITRVFDVKAKGMARRKIANEVLENIHPPLFIERGPRSFNEVAFWKAHEWANFVYYYLLPIYDVLEERLLVTALEKNNMLNFVSGIYFLNGNVVSENDIKRSSEHLSSFSKGIPLVHNKGFCTYNVHQATHLPESVMELGPLWATSMFQFEGFNSTVINSCNGTQHLVLQIETRLSWKRSLYKLHEDVEKSIPDSVSLEQKLFRRSRNKCLKLQKVSSQPVNESERKLIAETFGPGKRDLVSYETIQCSGKQYSTWANDFGKANVGRKSNCYVFNSCSSEYCMIRRLIVEGASRVFILFSTVKGSETELNYCIKNCRISPQKYVDLLDGCIEKCLRIDTICGMYLMKKINKCVGS